VLAVGHEGVALVCATEVFRGCPVPQAAHGALGREGSGDGDVISAQIGVELAEVGVAVFDNVGTGGVLDVYHVGGVGQTRWVRAVFCGDYSEFDMGGGGDGGARGDYFG